MNEKNHSRIRDIMTFSSVNVVLRYAQGFTVMYNICKHDKEQKLNFATWVTHEETVQH
jgi:hypothetical protein